MVSSTGMTFIAGTDSGDRRPRAGGDADGRRSPTRPPVVRYATCSLQRVRAFMRVTRSAIGSTCCGSVEASGSARLTPRGGRRRPVGLLSDVGGPGPLTEDRQKTETRL